MSRLRLHDPSVPNRRLISRLHGTDTGTLPGCVTGALTVDTATITLVADTASITQTVDTVTIRFEDCDTMTTTTDVAAGTMVRSTARFTQVRDGSGLADPTYVNVQARRGDDTTVTLTGDIVHESTGVYHVDIPTDEAHVGTWWVRWEASGTGPNVVDLATFRVHRGQFHPASML